MVSVFALLALGWSAARELELEVELPSGGSSVLDATSEDAKGEGVKPFLLPLTALLGGLGAAEGRALQAVRPRETRTVESEGRAPAFPPAPPRATQVVRAPWAKQAPEKKREA